MTATASQPTTQPRVLHDIYVGGAWVPSTSDELIDVHNPYTERVIAQVPAGSAEDVDAAVSAARAAFEQWSQTPVGERAAYLNQVADLLTERTDDLAAVITSELGMPLKMAKLIQLGTPIGTLRTYAKFAEDFQWETEVGNSLIVREPIGVVAAITPWNYPLHQIVAKVAPALVAGNTVVLKPSEIAPLIAYEFARVLDEVGLPPGVFNLISGAGPEIGQALVGHPDVDMVSFTGSGRAGREISATAAQTVKRVALELGGKSAAVILDDLDNEAFAKAIKSSVGQCFTNAGQRCTAFSRILVPGDRLDEALTAAAKAAESHVAGDPMTEGTRLGPLVSEAQRDRVRGFLTRAVDGGARVVTGGPDAPSGVESGYFVSPTVLTDVDLDSEIAQEEVFGPVTVVLPYSTVDEAVRIANDTSYGLAAGVYGADADAAVAVAKRLRAGQVDVNNGRWNWMAPFGGYKQSGNGREFGTAGLEEFLETKAVQR
ncbi:MAG: aldehyde dehydrogenase family protein [Actinomycetota bacterium]|nr:aldehyde dehydrogenase family protein [Actinomycetota bacterium]